jgi:hypothetical protein
MGLADYVTACTPPDNCTICRFKAQVVAEDAAYDQAQRQAVLDHQRFVKQLRRWAKLQPPDVCAKILAMLNQGDRECPMPLLRPPTTAWKGWSR